MQALSAWYLPLPWTGLVTRWQSLSALSWCVTRHGCLAIFAGSSVSLEHCRNLHLHSAAWSGGVRHITRGMLDCNPLCCSPFSTCLCIAAFCKPSDIHVFCTVAGQRGSAENDAAVHSYHLQQQQPPGCCSNARTRGGKPARQHQNSAARSAAWGSGCRVCSHDCSNEWQRGEQDFVGTSVRLQH